MFVAGHSVAVEKRGMVVEGACSQMARYFDFQKLPTLIDWAEKGCWIVKEIRWRVLVSAKTAMTLPLQL